MILTPRAARAGRHAHIAMHFAYAYYQQDWPDTSPETFQRRQDGTRHALVETGTVVAASPTAACEQLYARHNRDDRPRGLVSCSMSMWDIVRLAVLPDGPWEAYQCATVGFQPMPGWTPPRDAGLRQVLLLASGLGRAIGIERERARAALATIDAAALTRLLTDIHAEIHAWAPLVDDGADDVVRLGLLAALLEPAYRDAPAALWAAVPSDVETALRLLLGQFHDALDVARGRAMVIS